MTNKGRIDFANIPDKVFYKIGEVAAYIDVKPHVLRYWEQEFDQLDPKKKGNGQRVYTKDDVKTAFKIKELLHGKRYSIAGAKAILKDMLSKSNDKYELEDTKQMVDLSFDFLESIKQEMERILKILKSIS